MTVDITEKLQNVLRLDNNDPSKEAKIGKMSGHRVASLVILGTTAVLAAVAATVAFLFAQYILGALFAASCVLIIAATIVTSRIDMSIKFQELFDQVIKKANEWYDSAKTLLQEKNQLQSQLKLQPQSDYDKGEADENLQKSQKNEKDLNEKLSLAEFELQKVRDESTSLKTELDLLKNVKPKDEEVPLQDDKSLLHKQIEELKSELKAQKEKEENQLKQIEENQIKEQSLTKEIQRLNTLNQNQLSEMNTLDQVFLEKFKKQNEEMKEMQNLQTETENELAKLKNEMVLEKETLTKIQEEKDLLLSEIAKLQLELSSKKESEGNLIKQIEELINKQQENLDLKEKSDNQNQEEILKLTNRKNDEIEILKNQNAELTKQFQKDHKIKENEIKELKFQIEQDKILLDSKIQEDESKLSAKNQEFDELKLIIQKKNESLESIEKKEKFLENKEKKLNDIDKSMKSFIEYHEKVYENMIKYKIEWDNASKLLYLVDSKNNQNRIKEKLDDWALLLEKSSESDRRDKYVKANLEILNQVKFTQSFLIKMNQDLKIFIDDFKKRSRTENLAALELIIKEMEGEKNRKNFPLVVDKENENFWGQEYDNRMKAKKKGLESCIRHTVVAFFERESQQLQYKAIIEFEIMKLTRILNISENVNDETFLEAIKIMQQKMENNLKPSNQNMN
jgi:hypothetical protein